MKTTHPLTCPDCDSEFIVQLLSGNKDVQSCPFCGSHEIGRSTAPEPVSIDHSLIPWSDDMDFARYRSDYP